MRPDDIIIVCKENMKECIIPVIIMPKKCTLLEIECEAIDKVLIINVNLTTLDTDGNVKNIYCGPCNMKLIDDPEVNIPRYDTPTESECSLDIITQNIDDISINEIPIDGIPMSINELLNVPVLLEDFNQSRVWIDPLRSPFVYNRYENNLSKHYYSTYQDICIERNTEEQLSPYTTQDVYNYEDTESHTLEDEEIEYNSLQVNEMQQNVEEPNNFNQYEDEELEYGMVLSHIPHEYINKNEIETKEEWKNGPQSENSALKQLMLPHIQLKQQKTIVFEVNNSQNCHTVQKITVNDPQLECTLDNERIPDVVIGGESTLQSNSCWVRSTGHVTPLSQKTTLKDEPDPKLMNSTPKIYQCVKCEQKFNQLLAFKQHVVNHKSTRSSRPIIYSNSNPSDEFTCIECDKKLKNKEKYELHCMGHGNPNLECDICHKVFASKSTRNNHRLLHLREHKCSVCPKSFLKFRGLKTHAAKMHSIFMCAFCNYESKLHSNLKAHAKTCNRASPANLTCNESFHEDGIRDLCYTTPDPETGLEVELLQQFDDLEQADSVIAKVISTKVFDESTIKNKRQKECNKVCTICRKSFDRTPDLKRHLIEHIIKSTMAKNPVSKNSTLLIVCEVCHKEKFNKVDKYKAHLREHAQLTKYECTICDKTFSDSSNFSKHKKIHGAAILQCDKCQRKFNSKKMLIRHIDYHVNNSPIACEYCGSIHYFKSTLKKHIKYAHEKDVVTKFKCKFCQKYFKALKEKWDHEWSIHKVRTVVADCVVCDAKFRKYSLLKKHCATVHQIEAPAKHILSKR